MGQGALTLLPKSGRPSWTILRTEPKKKKPEPKKKKPAAKEKKPVKKKTDVNQIKSILIQ